MKNFLGFGLFLVLAALFLPVPEVQGYPLTAEQRLRLKNYAPRTFELLERKETLYVVALGDSVTLAFSPVKEEGKLVSGNSLNGYVGVFLESLVREFFYPGGVRLVNPPRGVPQKKDNHIGREILLENLAIGGRCMVDSMQEITTEAFVHQPDLVIVNYGINDAVRRLPLDEYRQALQYTIDTCKANKADIIVASPNLINQGNGAIDWGLTRPYVQVAREVAEKNGVLFSDLGQAFARWGGGQDDFVEPLVAMELVHERLRRMFDWGETIGNQEKLHPNRKAHEYMGQALFEDFLNPPEPSDYTINGHAELISAKDVKVSISLRNQSPEEKVGFLGALGIPGHLEPINAVMEFALPPGQNQQFEFVFERPVIGNHPNGDPFYGPWNIDDPTVRVSFILTDSDHTELLEPRNVKLAPLTISWRKQYIDNVTSDQLRLEWVFSNGTDKSLTGKYRIGCGDDVKPSIGNPPGTFTLPPLGEKTYFANFTLPTDRSIPRVQRDVFVEIEVDGKKFRYDRELEATRDLVLGERVPLSPTARYGIGYPGDASPTSPVTLRVDADANALFATVDLAGIQLQDLGDQPSIALELFIDARPQNEVRALGFVDRVRAEAPARDGPGITKNLRIGVFGNSYNMRLDPRGISSNLKTPSADTRRFEMRIPREYMFRHEWAIGNPNSILGLKATVFIGKIDPKTGNAIYPVESQYTLTAPSLNLSGTKIVGPYVRNAATLQVLRLGSTPVDTWSVRIY